MVPERLTTQRYILRRFNRRDIDALTAVVRASMDDLHRWLPWAYPGYTRDDAASYIRESMQSWREARAFDYAVRPMATPGRHVGNVSIWHVSRSSRTAEIGYWVVGAGTEVTARLVRLGFEHLGLHKINLRIAVGNRASDRIAEKLGFSREGVLREELLIRGRWVDHTLYSLLEQEWRTSPWLDAETTPG